MVFYIHALHGADIPPWKRRLPSKCILFLDTPSDQWKGLQLTQSSLAHERWLEENREKVNQLEKEVDSLIASKHTQ